MGRSLAQLSAGHALVPEKPVSAKGLRVWLCDLTYTQQTIAADVMPNAIGGIATFAEQYLVLDEPIRLFKYPERLAKALEEAAENNALPDVVAFSNYIWNSRLSYGFADAIKEKYPKTVIAFGGPNYPVGAEEQAQFLACHPSVDFYVIKEGELAFLTLLLALIETSLDVEAVKQRSLPSIHSRDAAGTVRITEPAPRITDLTEIPSPYTAGKLDEFFDGALLPIVQTNRGCPFFCTFCAEGVNYFNKVYRSSSEKISLELDYIGKKMLELRARGGRNDLFIADSNFGMFAEDLETCRQLARTRELYQWPEYINVATGKNKKERVLEASRIIDGALRLSGSVQSLDPKVLKDIKRQNISAEGLLELGLAANKIGANTYSEIILALPSDTKKAHLDTVRTVMDAGFTNLYLFQLMLLPGTDMATTQSKHQYGMVTQFRVLPRCYGVYSVLGKEVRAAEVEEICVSNSTLSFDDYLECRRFHLIVTIFHNDGVFGSLLKLLRSLDVSVFRWMELLLQSEPDPDLLPLFASFQSATRSELWEREEELHEFIGQPGNIEKFLAGELGNNLLFVHKTIAITKHIDALARFAQKTLLACLQERDKLDADTIQFVNEALMYHVKRAKNLFSSQQDEPSLELSFDIAGFEDHGIDFRKARLEKPRRVRFVLEKAQCELIDRYLKIYGDSPVSLGRILSKVHVKKLFRHAVWADEGPQASSEAKDTESFHISGLQN